MQDREARQARATSTQFRAMEQDGQRRIEGHFAVFGAVYTLWPGATESVDRGAFDDALDDDIRALIDHDTRLVLGRTKSGTLELRVDNTGLWGSILINEADVDAMNLYHRVQRGDVDQCSFGFNILEEKTDIREDGTIHWTILKVRLLEVSPVTFPAYEETSISARKHQAEQIKKRSADAWRETMKARLRGNGTEPTAAD